MTRSVVSYVPAIHLGYYEFFVMYPGNCFVLGPEVLAEFPLLVRDMRALKPQHAVRALQGFSFMPSVSLFGPSTKIPEGPIVMPDDEISRAVAGKYFPDREVEFVSIFLRWGSMAVFNKTNPAVDRTISKRVFDIEMMQVAQECARRSSDWWRQIGALAMRDGEILIVGHNSHPPTGRCVDIDGDPRSNFEAGEHIELSTALHGEIQVIAFAARKGIRLEGASLYVTTFPCRGCANAIAEVGFERVYFEEGYSQIAADEILRQCNVEIVQVQMGP